MFQNPRCPFCLDRRELPVNAVSAGRSPGGVCTEWTRPSMDGGMALRQTLQWMLILVASLVIAGGAGVFWVWSQSEALLKKEIQTQLAKFAPDLPIVFEKAALETDGRVRVSAIRMDSLDHSSTLLRLPEIVVHLDRQLLVDHRQFSARKVTIQRPQLTLEQSAEGEWSWNGITPPKPAGMAWPEVEILDAEILLRAHRESPIPVEIRLTNLDAKLTPTARGQCEIRGHGDLDLVGPVEIHGLLDTATGQWKIEGLAQRIPMEDKLIGMAAELSESVKSQVNTVTRNIKERTSNPALATMGVRHANSNNGIQTAAAEGVEGVAPRGDLIPRIGLRADLELQWEVASEGFGEPIDYLIDLKIENGELTDLFPIPLYEMSGRILVGKDRLKIQNLKASNGDSQLTIHGVVPLIESDLATSLKLHADNLPVDKRVRELTPKMTKLYDLLQPEGRFDIDVSYAPDRSPPIVLNEFKVRDGSMKHDLFRYQVNTITGTIVQRDDRFVFDMQGQASGHLGHLTGYVRVHGPDDLEADLRVQTLQGLPIDETLIAAFDTPKLKAIAATLRALRVQGEGDVDVSFRRKGGAGNKFQTFLDAHVRRSEINYVRFPIPFHNVSGHITHDPTLGNVWHFQDLKGSRGDAEVSGVGSYVVTEGGGGQLDLTFDAFNVPVDATLKAACITATDRLQEVWNQLNPSAGNLEFQKLNIRWSPGGAPLVTMPMVRFSSGAVMLAAIPLPLDRVAGALSWDGQRAEIEHAEGWHGGTFFRVDSTAGKAPAYFALNPADDVSWRLHLPDLSATRVVVDEELERALPDSIRTTVEALDPRGPLDLDLALDLKQFHSPKKELTASWKMDLALKGNQINAGVTLDRATGHVHLIQGLWNGSTVTAEGYADLDSVRIWDLPVQDLSGPFSIIGNRIIAGQPQSVSVPYDKANPKRDREVTGTLYDGKVTVNADVVLSPQSILNTAYNAEISVRDARLEQWAQEHQYREKLRGPINGKVNIRGKGPSPLGVTGEGYVQVTHAQLYELPVLLQVFSKLNLRAQGDQAFRYGYADITLGQGVFDFPRIELVGDTVSLVGRGFVGFAGEQERRLGFDFYSDARSQIQIPVVSNVLDRLGSKWVRVRVDGTIDNQKAVFESRIPILDEAFGGFIEDFEAGRRNAPPQLPSAGRGSMAPRR